jgi:hypothetical protein
MKKEIIIVWVIVLVVLTAFISIYLTYRTRPKDQSPPQNNLQVSRLEQIKPSPFRRPLDEVTGIKNVGLYRDNLLQRSNGVIYDADTILHYLKNIYPRLKQQMGKDTTGYTWKVGFYWMATKGKDSMNRLSFCVVPTLVSITDPTKSIDYFKDSMGFYNHPAIERGTVARLQASVFGDPPDNVYDEGQLWP